MADSFERTVEYHSRQVDAVTELLERDMDTSGRDLLASIASIMIVLPFGLIIIMLFGRGRAEADVNAALSAYQWVLVTAVVAIIIAISVVVLLQNIRRSKVAARLLDFKIKMAEQILGRIIVYLDKNNGTGEVVELLKLKIARLQQVIAEAKLQERRLRRSILGM